MRLSRRVAPALAAVTLVMAVPTDAIPRTSGDDDGTGLARSARAQPFGAYTPPFDEDDAEVWGGRAGFGLAF